MKSYDWNSVDFSRPNAEIAAELGCPESSVSRARKRFGISRERVDWNGVNWADPDTVIAAKLGVTPRAVGKARLRITGETGRKAGRPKKESYEKMQDTILKTLTVERPSQTVKVDYVVERVIPAGLITVKEQCECVRVEVTFHTGPLAGYRFRHEDCAMDFEGAIFIGEYSIKGRMWRVKIYTWGDPELEKIGEFFTLQQERLLAYDKEAAKTAAMLDRDFANLYAAVDCDYPVEDVGALLKKLGE